MPGIKSTGIPEKYILLSFSVTKPSPYAYNPYLGYRSSISLFKEILFSNIYNKRFLLKDKSIIYYLLKLIFFISYLQIKFKLIFFILYLQIKFKLIY